MQPYLLAYCEEKPHGLTRSVLTAVARVGPNKSLFATCKHAVTQHDKIIVVDENGVTLRKEWALIPTSLPDLDLCFLFLRHDVPADRIKLSDAPIKDGWPISHARNRFAETAAPSPFVTHKVPAKVSPLRAELGWSLDGALQYRFLESKGDREEAFREGSRTFYRVLEMTSWPGVSGSALWDKFGAIRGLVCGGDEEASRLKDGIPRLVYIPARTIAKEAAMILRSPQYRARMSRE